MSECVCFVNIFISKNNKIVKKTFVFRWHVRRNHLENQYNFNFKHLKNIDRFRAAVYYPIKFSINSIRREIYGWTRTIGGLGCG